MSLKQRPAVYFPFTGINRFPFRVITSFLTLIEGKRVPITATRLLIFAASAALMALPADAGDRRADPLAPLPAMASNDEVVVTGRRLSPPAGPDAMGTATLAAGVTLYDVRFRRVSAADRADPAVLAIAAGLAGLPRQLQLARVKSLVERRVRLATDLETLGVSDYWEPAGDTLRRGKGDGEDIAIVEMQALAAAGFPRDDLYISVGRHPRLGAHAVLIARVGADYAMLDATEPTVVDASTRSSGHFVPMFSMGTRGSWLHGLRHGSAMTLASARR